MQNRLVHVNTDTTNFRMVYILYIQLSVLSDLLLSLCDVGDDISLRQRLTCHCHRLLQLDNIRWMLSPPLFFDPAPTPLDDVEAGGVRRQFQSIESRL